MMIYILLGVGCLLLTPWSIHQLDADIFKQKMKERRFKPHTFN